MLIPSLELYLEPFKDLRTGFLRKAIFAKRSILDVWQGSDNAQKK